MSARKKALYKTFEPSSEMRTVYYVGGFVAASVGVGYLMSLEQAPLEPAELGEPAPEADLALVDNGELLVPAAPVPGSLADEIGGMLKTMVPYASGAIGVEAALVLASRGAQKGVHVATGGALAKYGTASIGKLGGGLAALGLAGDLSELANDKLRGQAVELLKRAEQNKQLELYVARQTEFDRATDAVDVPLLELTSDLAEGSVEKGLADGALGAIGSIATAPIEIVAVVDTAMAMHQARAAIIRREQGDFAASAYLVSMGYAMVGDVVVGGLGGSLADMIAQTPEERARAEVVLQLLNPANARETGERLAPHVEGIIDEVRSGTRKIIDQIDEAFQPLAKPKSCHCPGGTSDAGAMCRRTQSRGSERGDCKTRHGHEERSRNGLFARCPGGWVPIGVGGRDPYRCRNTKTPGCREYHSKPKNCPGGWAPQGNDTCWRLESKTCS
jgi:hypothetical protein